MPEIFRTRDVVVHFKGDAFPVAIHPTLLTSGWPGCQGVRWTSSPEDDFMVTTSDGIYGGFLLWGSDEMPDRLTGMQVQQLVYGYGILCVGGWLLSTSTYERYTWDSRNGIGPPNVPIVYHVGERLVFSNRGWWTNQDEWTKTGDPRAPNTFYVASVVQVPRPENNDFLVLQTSI